MAAHMSLTEEVVLSQRQQVVWHHQSIRSLQEPHRSPVQNGGTEETLFVQTPKHWSSTVVYHHPGWRHKGGDVSTEDEGESDDCELGLKSGFI